MGDLERRLEERGRQLAEQQARAAAFTREQEQTKEAERQQRLQQAKALGQEMVELLQRHNVPVVPMWKWEWVYWYSIPAHLRATKEPRDQIRKYEQAGEGWRITNHYVHLSDYSGGTTTKYALGTDGTPYTYGYERTTRYPYFEVNIENPPFEGIVGITEVKDGCHTDDNSRAVLSTLQSSYFQDGLLSLIRNGSPASTMYDQAYPFRNK